MWKSKWQRWYCNRKVLDDKDLKQITELCNLVCDTGYLPPDMSSSIFVRLPKKAKATECSDYRTLSLMSHILKIPLKVILKRNKHNIESVISETQSDLWQEHVPGRNLQSQNNNWEIHKVLGRIYIFVSLTMKRLSTDVKIIECMENSDILGVRSLANASRARQFNPLNPPGVGWVNFFFKVRVSIRTCVPNLG